MVAQTPKPETREARAPASPIGAGFVADLENIWYVWDSYKDEKILARIIEKTTNMPGYHKMIEALRKAIINFDELVEEFNRKEHGIIIHAELKPEERVLYVVVAGQMPFTYYLPGLTKYKVELREVEER